MNKVTSILERFTTKRVLVVGDLMLDRYLVGSAARLSPEAPVPVVLSSSHTDSLGGAANVARNITALGASCDLAGFVGTDEPGEALRSLCKAAGIGTGAVMPRPDAPTTMKMRVLSGNHQLLRIDTEHSDERSREEYDALFLAVVGRLEANPTDAIVVSDYAKGVSAPGFMERLNRLAASRKIPVLVDPKGADFRKYIGATVMKPNRSEMATFAARHGWSTTDLVAAAESLRAAAGLAHVVLTLGDEGLVLVSHEGNRHIPTRAREVFDVTGAGDTVMATLVLAMQSGMDLLTSAEIANQAAAIAVSRAGCAAVGLEDLARAISSSAFETALLKTAVSAR